MKKITLLLITSIILTFFTNFSYAGNNLVTKSEKTKINVFIKKYIAKVNAKYTKGEIINKFVKIIKKIDNLNVKFKSRNNISNKDKILQILSVIKTEMKTYLINFKSSDLNKDMKNKLKEIGIFKSNTVDSIMLKNGVEVYKDGNKHISDKNVIYYIRLLDNNLDDINSDKNEVYIKKAIFKNGKFVKGSNTFVARLGSFTNSDLYELKEDFKNVPKCYNAFNSYKGTKYEGIADSMLYVSDNYYELINKIEQNPQKSIMLNLGGNMCPIHQGDINKMRWLRFKANKGLIDFFKNDLKSALQKLK